jgi:hypothetical protein
MGQVQTKPLRGAPVALSIALLCVELSKHHFLWNSAVNWVTASMDVIRE